MTARATSVLVVDDNRDLGENIAEILTEIGVDVSLAKSAEDAMACLDDRAWSLVVTDVRMPGADGLELLAMIKARSPATPVLVMTGYADGETVARAHHSGALAVVHKPIDLDAFIELVTRLAVAETPILVVEDDISLCGNLTDILCEQEGIIPHPATNMALARRLAANVDFRAALVDLRLPDGDGLTLAKELLVRPDGTRRTVIIMTGFPEQLQEIEPLERLDTDGTCAQIEVLTKPVPLPGLLERLRKLV